MSPWLFDRVTRGRNECCCLTVLFVYSFYQLHEKIYNEEKKIELMEFFSVQKEEQRQRETENNHIKNAFEEILRSIFNHGLK